MRQQIGNFLLTDFRLHAIRALRITKLVSWNTLALLGGEVRYPQYSFGLASACREAKALGINKISALEFGVAGGNGLMALASAAHQCTIEFGIEVQVFGFDSGIGMPNHQGFVDAPYLWKQGDFRMDAGALRDSMPKSTNVIIGQVSDSVPFYLSKVRRSSLTLESGQAVSGIAKRPSEPCTLLRSDERFDTSAPIAFVSFDLDYYSSTKAALQLFRGAPCLPRVWTYFDDLDFISKQTGEWLAIDEFNSEMNGESFISEVALSMPSWVNWAHRMRVLHNYNHPMYNNPTTGDLQLPLAL